MFCLSIRVTRKIKSLNCDWGISTNISTNLQRKILLLVTLSKSTSPQRRQRKREVPTLLRHRRRKGHKKIDKIISLDFSVPASLAQRQQERNPTQIYKEQWHNSHLFLKILRFIYLHLKKIKSAPLWRHLLWRQMQAKPQQISRSQGGIPSTWALLSNLSFYRFDFFQQLAMLQRMIYREIRMRIRDMMKISMQLVIRLKSHLFILILSFQRFEALSTQVKRLKMKSLVT